MPIEHEKLLPGEVASRDESFVGPSDPRDKQQPSVSGKDSIPEEMHPESVPSPTPALYKSEEDLVDISASAEAHTSSLPGGSMADPIRPDGKLETEAYLGDDRPAGVLVSKQKQSSTIVSDLPLAFDPLENIANHPTPEDDRGPSEIDSSLDSKLIFAVPLEMETPDDAPSMVAQNPQDIHTEPLPSNPTLPHASSLYRLEQQPVLAPTPVDNRMPSLPGDTIPTSPQVHTQLDTEPSPESNQPTCVEVPKEKLPETFRDRNSWLYTMDEDTPRKLSQQAPTRRALLIAGPSDGKPDHNLSGHGPKNDVNLIAEAFRKYGFEVTKCCDEQATRSNIVACLDRFVQETEAEDMVVMYYSGCGGRSVWIPSKDEFFAVENDYDRSQRFLLPTDFDAASEYSSTVISESELLNWELEMTQRTADITVIMDCSYDGRIIFDPSHGTKARPRNIPEVQVRHPLRKCHIDPKSTVVRIEAASFTGTAWEYWGSQNHSVHPIGVFTKCFATALDKTFGQGLSWKMIMNGVKDSVKQKFPRQTPRVDGLDSRVPFSKEQRRPDVVDVTIENGNAQLLAGRVAGIRKGSMYNIWGLKTDDWWNRMHYATAKVTNVNEMTAKLSKDSGRYYAERLYATLIRESWTPLLAVFPSDLPVFEEWLKRSEFLDIGSVGDGENQIIFEKNDDFLTIQRGDVVLAKRSYSEDKKKESFFALVGYATMIAQGQLFLALISEGKFQPFIHKVDIELGLLHDGGRMEELAQDGTAKIREKQPFYLKLRNNSHRLFVVCVFSVSVTGTVSQSRVGIPAGCIRLESGSEHILGGEREMRFITPLMMQDSLSDPVVDSLEENLVFVIAERTDKLMEELESLFKNDGTSDKRPLPESGKPEAIHHDRCIRSIIETKRLLSLLRREWPKSTNHYVHYIPCTIKFTSQSSEQPAASS
ncbi:unnamed protein product [Alternaria alternata]